MLKSTTAMPSRRALMYDSAPNARRSALHAPADQHRQPSLDAAHLDAADTGIGAQRQGAADRPFGAVLSVLLAWLTWLLARGRVRARGQRSSALAEELKEGQATLMVLADSAQRSQAMLRSILDSTIDGILVDNLRGTCSIPTAASANCGMCPNSWTGRPTARC
jgi:hypothetical protein